MVESDNSEHQGKPQLALVIKSKQPVKKKAIKMSQEQQDLATHTEICAIRYKRIEEKFDDIEHRISKIEDQVADLKTQTQQGFSEIKVLLERQNSSRSTTLVTTIGSIIVAVIGVIGYLVTSH
jgi:chromosome segregation ATPase